MFESPYDPLFRIIHIGVRKIPGNAGQRPSSDHGFVGRAVYDPDMTLGEVFRTWKTQRTRRKAAVQRLCEACGGPLGDDPWLTYFRVCSAGCEETAGSRWTM
jgi:hypothetical protein